MLWAPLQEGDRRPITIHTPDTIGRLHGNKRGWADEDWGSDTLPGCRALPRPPPAVSPCSRPQGSPTICILHMGLQMGREVTVRSCSGICYEAPGGERATGDNHIALGSLAEMYTADGCVSWPLQPCLIFLASLKRVLHKFSWPGKFLRGQ